MLGDNVRVQISLLDEELPVIVHNCSAALVVLLEVVIGAQSWFARVCCAPWS